MSAAVATHEPTTDYQKTGQHHMAPLRESMAHPVPEKSQFRCVPTIRTYDDVRSPILASGSLIGAKEAMRRVLLLTPLLLSLVKALGVDPVHSGIVFLVNLGIGPFHPPFGVNIFVAQTILRLPLDTIYRGIVPFVFVCLIGLAMIIYVPAVSLAGVHWLMH